jgi:peptidyl-prolyl cis-trans isomerase D
LLATGADPENPTARPDPALAPILQAAFAVEPGDAPQLVPVGSDGGFALVALGNVVPAAPRPLPAIREQVARDSTADRARQAARRIATQVIASAGKGATLPQALGSTGLRLPPPRPLNIARSQIAANPRGTEPALALLFAMAPGTAKLLESPGRDGWLVIKLDRVQPGNAAGNQQLVNATRADIGRVVGREYAEQFIRATRNAVGVEIDREAVGRVRAELQGQSR